MVSPYLGFIPSLSVFQCFGWYEALNGRLIGPKTWDQIVEIFFENFFNGRDSPENCGLLVMTLCIKMYA